MVNVRGPNLQLSFAKLSLALGRVLSHTPIVRRSDLFWAADILMGY
jgi:hypothetical protein